MNSTKLSTILSRMNRYQTISNIEESLKVRDIDEAIRSLRRETQTPWSDKKGTLRVFNDIIEYPIASDHDAFHYIDKQNQGKNSYFPANFYFTSTREFLENQDYRNDVAEIWENGTRFLGVRYDDFSLGTVTLDQSSDVTKYSTSGDAGTPVLDSVFFSQNSSSIRIPISYSSGLATVNISPNSLSDANYKKKYLFVYIFLGGTVNSIDIKFGNDNLNYLIKNVTTQFSGTGFVVNDWNLIAMDLNSPDAQVGNIDSSAFDYLSLNLNGAQTGNYYIDESSLREWQLLDYRYYSTYNVKTSSSLVPNQDYFFDSNESYDISSELVGDKEWVDVITYDAILCGLIDKENSILKNDIKEKRAKALQSFLDVYPSEKPYITNNQYMFDNDYGTQYNLPTQ